MFNLINCFVVNFVIKFFKIFVCLVFKVYFLVVIKFFINFLVVFVLLFKRWKINCFRLEEIKIFIEGFDVILNFWFLL